MPRSWLQQNLPKGIRFAAAPSPLSLATLQAAWSRTINIPEEESVQRRSPCVALKSHCANVFCGLLLLLSSDGMLFRVCVKIMSGSTRVSFVNLFPCALLNNARNNDNFVENMSQLWLSFSLRRKFRGARVSSSAPGRCSEWGVRFRFCERRALPHQNRSNSNMSALAEWTTVPVICPLWRRQSVADATHRS